MQRRARIKVSANLSTARRGTNKGTAIVENQEIQETPKQVEEIQEITEPINVPQKEKQPESPVVVFSPPSTPLLSYNKARSDTPADSPSLVINHNVHYPATTQSPLIPVPHHPRIRTESLCSIKSTTVANLQPRKKVRTEDQKILDNKRESRERLSNKQIDKSQLRMFDMIYFNPTTNPMKPKTADTSRSPPKKIDLTMELPPTPPPVEKEPSSMPVPQLRLNANGEMVLDETSLVVENEEQKKNRLLLANTNVVYHDELSGNYGYYKRQQRTKEWPQDETIKFFRCLNTVGTDFSLMLNLFPNRSRRDLKLKFKKEEKLNSSLVDKALRNHSVFDIEELQRELDEEEEVRRKEVESKSSEVKEIVKRKILNKQEAKAKAQQQIKSKIEKILSDGNSMNVDNPVQEVKENLGDGKIKPKRQSKKRKAVKEEKSFGFKKIILETQTSSITDLNINTNDLDIVIAQDFESISTKKCENKRDVNIIQEIIAEIPNQNVDHFEDDAEATEKFIAKKCKNERKIIIETEATSSSSIADLDVVIAQDFESISSKKCESKQEVDIIQEIIAEIPIEVEDQTEDNLKENTGKFITDMISQTLNDEDDDEEMPEEEEEEFEFSDLQEYNKDQYTITSVKQISKDSNQNEADDMIEDEILPPQSVDSQDPVDDESFLNSLDLERLVIVVKQVDGNEIYDIHETDAETQKLSEKPLKLPQHIVELIVSVMTQED